GEGAGGEVAVVARGARVVEVPGPRPGPAGGASGAAGDGVAEGGPSDAGVTGSGALVVLSVPAATAHRLVGAGARTRLAVTLC
ncbi:hypothetical protein GTW67_29580, partial [Streptomyces sp. SID5910]|nr:hypothetical protein [Streptomyces sp. SID5910]